MDLMLKIFLLAAPWLSQARVISAPRQARLSILENQPSYYFQNIDGYPGTYSFGYSVSDPQSDSQFRTEERYPNGTVHGTYGYVDGAGRPYRYKYTADEKGYRVSRIKPSTSRPPQNFQAGSPQESSITWTRSKSSMKNKIRNWPITQNVKLQRQNNLQQNRVERPVYYSYSA